MIPFADLEIRILPRGQDGGCPVEITYSGELELPRGRLDPALLDWTPEGIPEEDGARLFAALFGGGELRDAWNLAQGRSLARRLRLYIDPGEAKLHALPWELMRDGVQGRPLAAGPDTPFSRYLPAQHPFGRPVFERPVRLLAAVANPPGLPGHGLPPLDVEKEKAALREALKEIPAEDLEIVFVEGPVTLAALREELGRPGRNVHVLHLLAHGTFDERQGGTLFLEDPAGGEIAFASARELAALIEEHRETLRLVVLASCESAKSGSSFRGIAQELVQAGVPAVLAMQDEVLVDDARAFTAAFYRHLLADGVVDLAANRARSVLLDAKSPDAGNPVVFLRLREGRLFGRRGEIQGESADLFWSNLLLPLAEGGCVPILGPGVTEGLFPSPSELARELPARLEKSYPFQGEDGDNLPRVAQFVGTFNEKLPRTEMLRLLTRGFRRRFGLPQSPDGEARLSDALRTGGWAGLSAAQEETEIHRQLASFELPLYLTTNFDNLMTLALEAAGRKPQRLAVPWRERDSGLAPEGTRGEPLVLHLFGNDEDLRSMVLTEDDHLEYLARMSRDEDNCLRGLQGDLAPQVLLFLGYRLHDLDLKVLMLILSHLNREAWQPFQVSVQVDPRQAAAAGCEDARLYLEKYFGRRSIHVYWGTAREFVAELHERREERKRG